MIGSEIKPAKPQGEQSPVPTGLDCAALSVSLPPTIDRNETLKAQLLLLTGINELLGKISATETFRSLNLSRRHSVIVELRGAHERMQGSFKLCCRSAGN
jgi:hypothetical protein